MEKARILIVEDEAIIAMEMESSLKRLGYEVTSIVDTGENAIEKAEADKPDIILMDIRIKGEMDGIDAAEQIRNRFGIPVIFSTAYLDEERIERAKITMPFGYVLKPIQERDLKITIEMAMYVSKVDIERRKAEEALQKSEERFRTIIENSKGVIFMIDKNGYFVLSEGSALSGLGLKPGQVVGMDAFEVYKEYPEITNALHRALKSETVHDPHLVVQGIRDKRHYDIFYSPNFVDGELIGVVGEAIDITKRKQTEEALQESEERHRTLFETMVQGVVYQDAEGKITDANPAAERILGLSLDQMQGRTSIDHRWKAIHEDDSDFPGDTHPAMVALKTGEKVNNVIMGIFHLQKEEHRWIRINAVPKFRKGESTPWEVYTTFDDITELKTGKK